MKFLKKSLTVLSIFLIASCSKKGSNDLENPPKIEDIAKTEVNVYKGVANSNDGLQGHIYDQENKAHTYIYGSFNQYGNPKKVKSIIVEKSSTDTIYNYLFDENNRLNIAYASLKNGNKINQLLKIDYLDNDKANVNVYEYNWNTGVDVLIKQYQIDYVNSTQTNTYSKIGSINDQNNLNKIHSINQYEIGYVNVTGTTIYSNATSSNDENNLDEYEYSIEAVLSDLKKQKNRGVIIFGGSVLIISTIAGGLPGFVACSVALALFVPKIAKADALQTTRPNYPISPTNSAIPNPTGTPQNPIGAQLIIGSWKITFVTNSCNANNYSEEMNNKTIAFSNSVNNYNSIVSITNQYNLGGYWIYKTNSELQFNSSMGNGSGVRYFNFTSQSYNYTTKEFFGTFYYENSVSNPSFSSICRGTMKLTKI